MVGGSSGGEASLISSGGSVMGLGTDFTFFTALTKVPKGFTN